MINLSKNHNPNILFTTDWVIYDKANDHVIQFGDGNVVIFGNYDEAIQDCRGNEQVIRCTDLPVHWQETILKQLNDL
jgi:hypothetical protein